MFCPRCGAQNADTAKFCRGCGNVLNSDQNDEKKDTKKIYYIIGAIVIIIALICAVFLGMRGKKAKEYETYLASAEKYIEELNYEQAKDFYLKAIEISPKQLEAYVKLAEVYIIDGDVETAKKVLEMAKVQEATGDDEIENVFRELNERTEEFKDMFSFEWIVEPKIEADDIYYPQIDSIIYNDSFRQIDSPYAIIKNNDSYGLIGLDGTLKADMEYKDIYTTQEIYVLWRKEPKWEEQWNYNCEHYMVYDDKLEPLIADFDLLYEAYYFYDGKIQGIDWFYDSIGADRVENKTIPVQKSKALLYMQGDEDVTDWNHYVSGKYAIFRNNKQKTEFIFDECGSESDGLMAVCKDGKWGYVNSDGETVIPLEYDASWKHFEFSWVAEDVVGQTGMKDYCYAASDGYVVLCKEDKWELRDINGEIAIPSGIFEEILPVYDGKCWVKQAGKWGVIKLKDNTELSEERSNPHTDDIIQEKYSNAEYLPVVKEALNNMNEVSYGRGYGALYDLDENGTDELIMLYTIMADTGSGDEFPARVCSVYTIQNGNPVALIEDEVLYYEAGGPEGYISIVKKDKDIRLVISSESGETDGGDAGTHRGGSWKLCRVSGAAITTETEVEYNCVEKYNGTNMYIEYQNSNAVINGEMCSYEEYEILKESYREIIKMDSYENTEDMELENLINDLQKL